MDKNEQNEVIVMLEDVLEGSKRGIDILAYIRQCANLLITKMRKDFYDRFENIQQTNCQKLPKKIIQISKSKPKGDIEMKNICYRPKEKRYIGRKQFMNKIVTVYAKTQLDCQKKLNNEINKIKINLNSTPKCNKITLIQYWDKWFNENKKPFLASKTIEEYNIVKRKFNNIYNLELTKINKETLLSFFSTLEDNRTKEKVITFLKAMFANALKEGKIKIDPFATLVFKLKKLKPKVPFNYSEQEYLLKKLKGEEIEPIILTYLITGLRKNELNFKSIENDIKNNVLTAVNLKNRDREIRYKKIKLSEAGVKMILDNIQIFHKYNSRSIYDKFNSFLKSIGLNGSIVNCRHTFATNCFYLGKDNLIISREMGHSTCQITYENYIDIDYDLSKEKLLKLYNNLYNLD